MKFKGGVPPYGFVVHRGHLAYDHSYSGSRLCTLMKAHEAGLSYRTLARQATLMDWNTPSGGKGWSHGVVARVVANGKKYSDLIPVRELL